jgi:hypothetical protein
MNKFTEVYRMREGWIKSHRKITDSAIWCMPPLYLKVWQYLLHAACFEEKNIPMKDGSFIKLEKGQHLTSIRVIAGKVSWYERGIEKSPNPKTISEILEWLITQNMIQIENGKNDKQYSLITIVNWDYYQTGNEAEGNSDQTESNQSLDIKNNYNNSKKEKEEKKKEEQKEKSSCLCASARMSASDSKNVNVNTNTNTSALMSFSSSSSSSSCSNSSSSTNANTSNSNNADTNVFPSKIAYKSTPGSTPTQDFMAEFDEFWDKYPRKHDRNNAYKCFTEKLNKGTKSSDLIAATSGYGNYCSSNKINMVYIKYPCNFLSEDQFYEEYIGYTKSSSKSSIYPFNGGKRIYGEYDLESLFIRG